VHGPQASVMVNPRVLGYDTLISLNQLKVHKTATVTLALKNIAMSYPAADYYGHPRLTQHHRHWFFDDMHSFIAAMAKRFPIHLAVTVGHPAMLGTGPLGAIRWRWGWSLPVRIRWRQTSSGPSSWASRCRRCGTSRRPGG